MNERLQRNARARFTCSFLHNARSILGTLSPWCIIDLPSWLMSSYNNTGNSRRCVCGLLLEYKLQSGTRDMKWVVPWSHQNTVKCPPCVVRTHWDRTVLWCRTSSISPALWRSVQYVPYYEMWISNTCTNHSIDTKQSVRSQSKCGVLPVNMRAVYRRIWKLFSMCDTTVPLLCFVWELA